MLKKSTVKLLNSEIVGYPSSQMMRNLLIAQVGHCQSEALYGIVKQKWIILGVCLCDGLLVLCDFDPEGNSRSQACMSVGSINFIY